MIGLSYRHSLPFITLFSVLLTRTHAVVPHRLRGKRAEGGERKEKKTVQVTAMMVRKAAWGKTG
jgi:hypothetical protein